MVVMIMQNIVVLMLVMIMKKEDLVVVDGDEYNGAIPWGDIGNIELPWYVTYSLSISISENMCL